MAVSTVPVTGDKCIQLLSELQPSPYSRALTATIAAVRNYPDLHKWWRDDLGPQSPGGPELARWHQSRVIQRWLSTVPSRRQQDAPGDLIWLAKDWLDEEPARLRAAWGYWHSTGAWEGLSLPARHLVSLLFALAVCHGPRVLLSNRAAVRGIELMTGERHSIGTITKARGPLLAAGIIEATIGQQWEKGKRSAPTKYNLLPDSLRSALAMETIPNSADIGIVSKPEDKMIDSCPQMTAAQLAAMEDCYGELRRHRKNQPEPLPVTQAEDFSYLLGNG